MKKSKNYLIIGITFIILAFGIIFSITKTQAQQAVTASNYVRLLYDQIPKQGGIIGNNVNRMGIINSYCKSIFSADLIDGFASNIPALPYTPKDSLFVRYICKDFASKTNFDAKYLIIDSRENLFQRKDCSRDSAMNNCPISVYFSKIFQAIINDYTNSKIASLYGYTAKLSDNSELNKQSLRLGAKNYSDYYFGPCANNISSEHIYINDKQISEGGEALCSHPNTYKVLSNYIENARNKIKNNKILNYNALLASNQGGKLIYDSFAPACSAITGQLDCMTVQFQHLVMNELMFYGLFMNMYAAMIPTSQQFGPLTIGKDTAAVQEALDEEVRKTQLEMEIANDSVTNTLKIVRNFYNQFPVHIGLVAYLEDLVGFRNQLVKLYTPIHQLYYKLRNAQTYAK